MKARRLDLRKLIGKVNSADLGAKVLSDALAWIQSRTALWKTWSRSSVQ